MRAVIQRVESAQVQVEDEVVGACGPGYLILLGVGPADDEGTAQVLWNKIKHLRICADGQGRTNLSLLETRGQVLVVSQFTLYADCRKGRRPSFAGAAAPDRADRLYQHFCDLAQRDVDHVGRGVFGAHMRVSLVNDGPFTVCLDTDDLARPR